jgi:hypothetical protein
VVNCEWSIFCSRAIRCRDRSRHPVHFEKHILAHDLAGGYQAIACDVYADGKLELIALASNMSDLVWVENPAWERHVLARHLRRMISLACWSRTPYAPPIYRRRL